MKPRELLKTIARTTLVTLGILALISLGLTVCIGSFVMFLGDPGVPRYSMQCTFDAAQKSSNTCVSSVFERNKFKATFSAPRSWNGKLSDLGDEFEVGIYGYTDSRESMAISIVPVGFGTPVDSFNNKQRELRAALRAFSNDIRDTCAPNASPITCETRIEETTHIWQ